MCVWVVGYLSHSVLYESPLVPHRPTQYPAPWFTVAPSEQQMWLFTPKMGRQNVYLCNLKPPLFLNSVETVPQINLWCHTCRLLVKHATHPLSWVDDSRVALHSRQGQTAVAALVTLKLLIACNARNSKLRSHNIGNTNKNYNTRQNLIPWYCWQRRFAKVANITDTTNLFSL